MRVDLCNYNYDCPLRSVSRCLPTFLTFAFPSSYTFVLSGNILLSLSRHQHDVYATFTRTLPSIFPIFLSPWLSPSLSVSRFGSYVYFILCFLHPLAATPEPPSPSTSTNILIIPWKPPRLRALTRSWKTRPSELPRGSVLSLPLPHTSLNFALELYTLSRCPSLSPASVALTFVTMESIRTLEAW